MSKRILLLEGEEEIRELLGDRLTALGYNVVQPVDAYVGLECAREHPIDLVLLNDQMPLITTASFMEALQQMNCLPPAIILTSKITEQKRTEFSLYTNCIFVLKPFQIDTLLDQVARLINTR